MIAEILKPLDQHIALQRQTNPAFIPKQLKTTFTIDELISIYSSLSEARREAPLFEEINEESQGKLPSSFYVSQEQNHQFKEAPVSRPYHETALELGEKVLNLLSERSLEVNKVAASKRRSLERKGFLWFEVDRGV